jgi:hypothetical protein
MVSASRFPHCLMWICTGIRKGLIASTLLLRYYVVTHRASLYVSLYACKGASVFGFDELIAEIFRKVYLPIFLEESREMDVLCIPISTLIHIFHSPAVSYYYPCCFI